MLGAQAINLLVAQCNRCQNKTGAPMMCPGAQSGAG
eukprot:SAG22_NODE_7861_length_701_cov_1.466777_1_plen_35_part_10